ncbi:hypothetical protein KRX57_08525 [Weeksellaceae bacterium TAE3-ERU29]|nr:hypothetical protein [Weeksellaceae bacterium TAE3-ERU29]
MEWTKNKKKWIFIGAGIFIFLYLIISIALPAFTEYKIKEILKNDTNFPYKVTFEDFDMQLFMGNASMSEIHIKPDSTKNKDESIMIENGHIQFIKLSSFSYSDLYFKNQIYAESIKIIKPDFKLRKNPIQKNEESESKSFRLAMDNNIHLKNVRIENGNVFLSTQNNDIPEVSLKNFNFEMKDIKISKATLKEKIPFTYGNFKIAYDSLYYKFSPIYFLKSGKAEFENHRISIMNFELDTYRSMPETQKLLKKEEDIFTIKNGNIEANGIDWSFQKDRLQVKIKNIGINDMNTRIYHNFIPPEDHSPSSFYSTKLRNLPFDLTVDSLQIKNNQLSYVEQEDFQSPESSIYFKNLNINGTNIAGGNLIKPETHTRLQATALFMDTGKTQVDWAFQPANQMDAFTFKGSIQNLKAGKFNSFLIPLANTKLSGTIDNVDFDLKGNKEKCTGTMTLTYNDLNIEIVNKKTNKVNKFLSSIVDVFVKDDQSKAEAEQVTIDNKRTEPNSFFNFIWKSLFQGIKKNFV